MNVRGDEIDENMQIQRRVWISERVGWVLMSVFTLAGLLGLLGPGPLADASATAPDRDIRVSYDRFARLGASSRLELEAKVPEGEEAVRVWIAQTWLDVVDVESLQPEPDTSEIEEGRVVYEFRANGARTAKIAIEAQPDRAGTLEMRAGVDGGGEIRIRQFVFP